MLNTVPHTRAETMTVLIWAIINEKKGFAKLLLDRAADTLIGNMGGKTALHLAVRKGHAATALTAEGYPRITHVRDVRALKCIGSLQLLLISKPCVQ
jgi:hypothetical protein